MEPRQPLDKGLISLGMGGVACPMWRCDESDVADVGFLHGEKHGTCYDQSW